MTTVVQGQLSRLDEHLAEQRRIAQERFDSLAVDLSDGLQFEPGEIEDTLSAAGKSQDDLRQAVELILKRREQAAIVTKRPDVEAEVEQVRDEIEEMHQAYLARVRPLEQRQARLRGELRGIEHGERALRESAPPFVRSAITRCAGRIKRLNEKMVKTIKKRSPALIVEPGHSARHVYDDGFDERQHEQAQFCEEAAAAIEQLQRRLAALRVLALTASPTRDDLAAIDAEFPEPDRVVYHGSKDAFGNPLAI